MVRSRAFIQKIILLLFCLSAFNAYAYKDDTDAYKVRNKKCVQLKDYDVLEFLTPTSAPSIITTTYNDLWQSLFLDENGSVITAGETFDFLPSILATIERSSAVSEQSFLLNWGLFATYNLTDLSSRLSVYHKDGIVKRSVPFRREISEGEVNTFFDYDGSEESEEDNTAFNTKLLDLYGFLPDDKALAGEDFFRLATLTIFYAFQRLDFITQRTDLTNAEKSEWLVKFTTNIRLLLRSMGFAHLVDENYIIVSEFLPVGRPLYCKFNFKQPQYEDKYDYIVESTLTFLWKSLLTICTTLSQNVPNQDNYTIIDLIDLICEHFGYEKPSEGSTTISHKEVEFRTRVVNRVVKGSLIAEGHAREVNALNIRTYFANIRRTNKSSDELLRVFAELEKRRRENSLASFKKSLGIDACKIKSKLTKVEGEITIGEPIFSEWSDYESVGGNH